MSPEHLGLLRILEKKTLWAQANVTGLVNVALALSSGKSLWTRPAWAIPPSIRGLCQGSLQQEDILPLFHKGDLC